jgi:hypothetical protein
MSTLDVIIALNKGSVLMPETEEDDRSCILETFELTAPGHQSVDVFEELFFDALQDHYIFGGQAHLEWDSYVLLQFNRYVNSMVCC